MRSGAASSSRRPAAAGVEQRLRDVRVVPGPDPFGHDGDRPFAALHREEDVEALAGGEDARERVDLGTTQAARVAAPVPVLVQVEDRPGYVIVEAGLAGDGRATLAAQLLDLAMLALAADPERDDPAQAPRQRFGVRDGADRERGVREQRGLDGRLAALGLDVVGPEDPADGRGVR